MGCVSELRGRSVQPTRPAQPAGCRTSSMRRCCGSMSSASEGATPNAPASKASTPVRNLAIRSTPRENQALAAPHAPDTTQRCRRAPAKPAAWALRDASIVHVPSGERRHAARVLHAADARSGQPRAAGINRHNCLVLRLGHLVKGRERRRRRGSRGGVGTSSIRELGVQEGCQAADGGVVKDERARQRKPQQVLQMVAQLHSRQAVQAWGRGSGGGRRGERSLTHSTQRVCVCSCHSPAATSGASDATLSSPATA